MFENELKDMIFIAKKASSLLVDYYSKHVEVEIKSDNSPVTIADKESNKLITTYLKEKYPTYAFLSEEDKDDLNRLNNDLVFIIDPLDGTEDFIKHTDQFAINIALSYKHEVVAGVIAVPFYKKIYYGLKDSGAFVVEEDTTKRISVSNKTEDLTCLTSVFHFSEKEKELITKHSDKIKNVAKCGSSYKACLIAEGKAELSYRLQPGTKEWDTAPFEIIVKEAGGVVLKPDFTPMKYNREDVYNREGYIIANKKENILL